MSKRILIVLAVVGLSTVAGTLAACGNDSSSSSATQAPPTTRPSFAPPTEDPSSGGGAAGGMGDMLNAALSDLVDKGTISAAQKQAVLDKLSSAAPQAPQGGAGGAAPSGDPQTGAPTMSDMFSTALDGLVEDNTITAAQKTAILNALVSALPQGGPPAGGDPGATPGAAPNEV